jgi:hypothetical protein
MMQRLVMYFETAVSDEPILTGIVLLDPGGADVTLRFREQALSL